MNRERLKETLNNFKDGKISEDEMISLLQKLPFENLGFAKVDHHRSLRHGFPEVIFGRGKTFEQVLGIAKKLLDNNPNLLITSAGLQVLSLIHI